MNKKGCAWKPKANRGERSVHLRKGAERLSEGLKAGPQPPLHQNGVPTRRTLLPNSVCKQWREQRVASAARDRAPPDTLERPTLLSESATSPDSILVQIQTRTRRVLPSLLRKLSLGSCGHILLGRRQVRQRPSSRTPSLSASPLATWASSIDSMPHC